MQLEENSDVELVEFYKQGSIPAFEELITRHETKAFNLALKFTKNKEDAEEVVQDVFTTLFRKLGSFEGKSAFSSWLYRIVVNAAFMKLRKRKQYVTMSIEDLSPGAKEMHLETQANGTDQSDCIALNHELREKLQESINRLPKQYRSVFVLRDVDGLSNNEVGKILNLTIPAVKSRLHRSRLMLRKKLERYYDDYRGIKPLREVRTFQSLAQ